MLVSSFSLAYFFSYPSNQKAVLALTLHHILHKIGLKKLHEIHVVSDLIGDELDSCWDVDC